MPEQFQYDVFLSHSAKDGDRIRRIIEEGLERSRVLVLCMSAHSFGSDWAQLESGTFRFRDPLNKERRFFRGVPAQHSQ